LFISEYFESNVTLLVRQYGSNSFLYYWPETKMKSDERGRYCYTNEDSFLITNRNIATKITTTYQYARYSGFVPIYKSVRSHVILTLKFSATQTRFLYMKHK
jgi:hypothetical protein